MYSQVIPTFSTLSALAYEELRIHLEAVKQSEGCREYRELYHFNNKKQWRMNRQQLQQFRIAKKLVAEISVQQHYGTTADVFTQSNMYYNSAMVYNSL